MVAATALRGALDEAYGVLTGGDAAEAERRAKAVAALVRAERELAELVAATNATAPEDNGEELRAELRRRIARFVEASGTGAPAEVLERIARGGSAE